MRLEYSDYVKLVKETYKKKRSNNELTPLLAQSTPNNIRKECANVYQERYDKKDEPMLRAFFGPAEPGRKFLALIQEFDLVKLKTLDYFLKEPYKKILSDTNVPLLAWLIDFEHRPYKFDNNIILSDGESCVIKNNKKTPSLPQTGEDNISQNKENETKNPLNGVGVEPVEEVEKVENFPIFSVPVSEKTAPEGSRKKWVLFSLVLIMCTGGIYAILNGKVDPGGCMYWAMDHYEKVLCNEDPKGRLFLPVNEEKIKSFKRITREDTLTQWSIGKVFYIKDSNKIKYYTQEGNYPENIKRPLRKLSPYMFNKYLNKKQTADTASVADKNED